MKNQCYRSVLTIGLTILCLHAFAADTKKRTFIPDPSGAVPLALEDFHPALEPGQIGPGMGSMHQLRVVDLNADGFEDILYLRPGMDAVEWSFYNGEVYQEVERHDLYVDIGTSVQSAAYVSLGDVNNDSFPDVGYVYKDNGVDTLRILIWDLATLDFKWDKDLVVFDEPRDVISISANTDQPHRFLTFHPMPDTPIVGFHDDSGTLNNLSIPATPVAAIPLVDNSSKENGVLIFAHSPNSVWLTDSSGVTLTDVSPSFPEVGQSEGLAAVTGARSWSLITGSGDLDIAVDFMFYDDDPTTATSYYYGNGSGDPSGFVSVWTHLSPDQPQAIWETPVDLDANGVNDLLYAVQDPSTRLPQWRSVVFGGSVGAPVTDLDFVGAAIMARGGIQTTKTDLDIAWGDSQYVQDPQPPDYRADVRKIKNMLEDISNNMPDGALKKKTKKVVKALCDVLDENNGCKLLIVPFPLDMGLTFLKPCRIWISKTLFPIQCSIGDEKTLRLISVLYHEGVHLGCKEKSESVTSDRTADFWQAFLDALDDNGDPIPGGILDGVSWRKTKLKDDSDVQEPQDPQGLGRGNKNLIRKQKWEQIIYGLPHKDYLCALARSFCAGAGGGTDPAFELQKEVFGRALDSEKPVEFTDPVESANGRIVEFTVKYCGFSAKRKGVKKGRPGR